MRKFRPLLAAALCLCLTLSAIAATPFENVVPENAFLLISAKNVPAMVETLKGYSVYDLWNEPSVQRFLEKPIARINEELQKAEGEAGVTLDEVKALFQGQVALFMAPKDAQTAEFVFMMDVGDKGPQAQKMIQALMAKARNGGPEAQVVEEPFEGTTLMKVVAQGGPDAQGAYALAGNVLLVGDGDSIDAMKRTITSLKTPPQRSVLHAANYQNALSRVGKDADFVAFIDVAGLLNALPPETQVAQFRPILSSLGLDGVISGAMTYRFGKDMAENRIFLNLAGEPRGVLRMVIPEAGPLHTGQDVPASAASFMASRFDFVRAYDELEKILAMFQPMAVQQLKMQEQQISQTIGQPFNLRNDILSVFGPGVSMYSVLDETQPMERAQKMVVSIDVTSNAAFQAAFDKLRKAVPMAFAMMQPSEYLGHQVYSMSQPQAPNAPQAKQQMPVPGFVATDTRLIISNDVESLKAHLRRAGKADGLAERADFKSQLSALPADKRVFISYSDPRNQAAVFLEALRTGQFAPILGAMASNPEAQEIVSLIDFSLTPPTEDVVKHLTPKAGVAVVGPDGLLVVSRSPARATK